MENSRSPQTKGLSRRQFLAGTAAAVTALTLPVHPQPAETTVVDIHAHMPLAKYGGPLAPRYARESDSDDAQTRALAEAVRSETFDAVAEFRVAEMDAWGVTQSVVMPIDFGVSSADMIAEENEAAAAVCRKHAGRLIPFLGVDPQRPEAAGQLERGVRDWEIRGVKIHPFAGFAIDDEAVFPFYKRCAELNIPVLGHCRPLGGGERDQLARPERYGAAAAAFPDLKLCLGHFGGGPWSEEALAVVERYPNAYGDLSTMQGWARENRTAFANLLRRAMDGAAAGRLMYATDWPTQRHLDVEFLAYLREGCPIDGEARLTPGEVDRLLGANARDFLGAG